MILAVRPPTCLRLAALAAAAASLAGPAAAKEKNVERATRAGIFLYGNGTEVKDLDPHIVSGDPENKVITSLLEGLIAYHPTDDYEPEPGVAEAWEAEEDGRIWTFRLRDDARWSNGDPVTASDFVYSHRRILTPELAADYADMLFIIEGAEAFNTGETEDFREVGVKALDDRTLRYELTGPTPFFLSMLKHYSFWPVHPPTIEKFGGIAVRASGWTRPGNFVGNGPFILTEWEFKNIIQVRRNPRYWDAERVQLNGIDFFPIEAPPAEELAFRDGQLHVTKETPLHRIPWYRENRPDLIRLDPYLCVYFYRINVTEPVLKDVRVRQALACAIDRLAIVRSITRAGERPAEALTPPPPGEVGSGYQPPRMLEFNPERGRALLAEAGFPEGRGFPNFDILINTHESHRTIAEAIQQMWKRHLGIDVRITNQSWQVYLDSQKELDFSICRAGWIGDFMDPTTFLGIWTEGNLNNNTGWSSLEFEALLAASGQETDQPKRFEILRQAEELLLTEMPIIPIYWYTSKHLVHPDVTGWHPKLLDNHNYKYLGLKPSGVKVR